MPRTIYTITVDAFDDAEALTQDAEREYVRWRFEHLTDAREVDSEPVGDRYFYRSHDGTLRISFDGKETSWPSERNRIRVDPEPPADGD